MTVKKKILISGVTLYLLNCGVACAEVNVDLNVGVPAYSVGVAPIYEAPYAYNYDPGHRNRDFRYWQEQRRMHAHPEHRDYGRQEGRNYDAHAGYEHR